MIETQEHAASFPTFDLLALHYIHYVLLWRFNRSQPACSFFIVDSGAVLHQKNSRYMSVFNLLGKINHFFKLMLSVKKVAPGSVDPGDGY